MNLKKPKRKNIKKISLPRNILWLLQKSENSFEKKQRQRKIRSLTFSFSSVIAAIMIFFLIFQLFPHNINAASYTWVQTDWLGGADTVNFPVHPTNQTNWNKYFSKDDGIATGNELSLTATTASTTQTTDADFNAGTNSNTAVSGTGADGKVQLAIAPFTCGSNVTFTYKGSSVTYGTVAHNGKCWLDRNLGASAPSMVTSYNDPDGYGDLFQWGRLDDGHQTRTSGTTTTLSNSDNPGHSNFIYGMGSPYDWRSPQNDNLWQGVNGTNNPCPSGWRIPTEAEWTTEMNSWSPINSSGAYASPLKLTVAGYRNYSNAGLFVVGSSGYYWSSTVDGTTVRTARYLYFGSSNTFFNGYYRAGGFSVRCIKDSSYSSYMDSGTFTSSAIDTGQNSNFTTLGFTIDKPANTDLKFQLRSAATEADLSSATWYGPTSTDDYYTTASQTINSVHDGHQWIQYKAYFSTTDTSQTPSLDDITINYTYYPASATSITQTTDADFNAGTNSGTAVSGTGADGKVQLAIAPSTCGSNVAFTYKGASVTYGTVLNPTTGECWLDRNLGASQAATSSTDAAAYGDLFQWGRLDDGHQTRTSGTTTTLSNSDNPGHSNFILSSASPYDWRSPQNNNLWQGVSGINNPCPTGWRIPTEAEWNAERLSWSSNNSAGAFASPLKLTAAGYRNYSATLLGEGSNGDYWSSTVDGTSARDLNFYSSDANIGGEGRDQGCSVRCIKDSSYSSYMDSGTFTSSAIDLGQQSSLTTLSYNTTTPTGTTLTIDARAGDVATPDATWTDWQTGVSNGGDISGLGSHRYVQYRANLTTTDTSQTPSLDDITINYTYYPASATLISSPYNTSDTANVVGRIGWSETLPSNTDIKFQIRTAPDSSGSPGVWTDWLGPTGAGDYYTDPTGGETINSTHTDGLDDQWIQYKVWLETSDGVNTPTLSDVTLTYVVNAPPEFDSTYGTNGVAISQISDPNNSNWGKVQIDYAIRDIDTTTGTSTPNYITPTFEYTLNGTDYLPIDLAGITFGNAPSGGNITDINTDGKADNLVEESNYLTYTAYWNAKTQIPESYSETFKIRVTIDDNEAANRYAAAVSNTATLDTANPSIGTHPILIDGSITENNIILSASDNSTLKMEVNLDNNFAAVLAESYAATKTLTLLEDPETVYVKYQDIYGNTTSTYSATTPETPTAMMIQDTSNLYMNPAEYRLFIAWQTVVAPTPGFASYKVYRSENSSGPWTDLQYTITDRVTNYYGDNNVTFDTHYYYKVKTVDSDGNVSPLSATVDGKANGAQDAGEGGGGTSTTPPTISNVTVSNQTTTSATVTWTTDVLSSSTVGYSKTPGDFTTEVGVASMVTNHSVIVSGLTPSTTYYFQVKSTGSNNQTAIDNNNNNGYTLQTLAGDNTNPTISDISETNITQSSATINWTTDEAATSFVEYSTQDGFTNGLFFGNFNLTTNHSIILEDLSPDTIYYYKIHSKDATNNEAVSTQRSFTTAPDTGDITPPQITNIQSNTPAYNTATITWATDEESTSYVEYGTTTSYGRIYGNNTLTTNHSVTLPGDLTPETLYHFRVRSADIANNEALSEDNNFTTAVNPNDLTAPTISNVTISEPTTTTATITWTTDEEATSYVGYSQDQNYANEQGNFQMTTNHSVTLAGLNPGTYYYFRIKSVDPSGNVSYQTNDGFSTQAGASPPIIDNIQITDVSESSAVIRWDTNIAANSFVEYGLTNAYGKVFGSYQKDTGHSVTLNNLLSNSTYHFRVRSTDETEAVSGDFTLNTAPDTGDKTPPQITDILTSNITTSTATITWTTNEDSNSIVEYGTAVDYNLRKANESESVTNHTINLTDLSVNTTYHYRIKSKDSAGNQNISNDQTFTTNSDTTAPGISQTEVEVISNTQVVITWTTDENASSQVAYGKDHSLNFTSSLITPTRKQHYIILTNLEPDTRYYFKVKSKDAANNEAIGEEMNFTTNPDPEFQHSPLSEITDIADPPSIITDTKAVVTFNTDQAARCVIEYGTESNNYSEVPFMENDYNRNHSIHMTGLIFSTTYYYQIICEDNLETVINSGEYSFTTAEQSTEEASRDTTAPEISGVDVSDITGESVTVKWNTDEEANSSVSYGIESGKYENLAGDYLVNSDSANYTTAHTVIINNLTPATKYYYKILSNDLSGNISESSEQTFTTKAYSSLSSIKIVSSSLKEAVITWKTDKKMTSIVEYGETNEYGETKTSSTMLKDHTVNLSNLKVGTVYHFRVKGKDEDNNMYSSGDYTFQPKSPPKISDFKLIEISENEARISVATDIPSDVLITYAEKDNPDSSFSQGNPNFITKHEIKLTNLKSGTAYTYTVKVSDEQGNQTISEEGEFTTSRDEAPPTIEEVHSDNALTQANRVQTIISCKTNEKSTATVFYREGRNGAEKELKMSANPTTLQVAVITSFKPGTVYTFYIKATDMAGNVAVSEDFFLLTPNRKENIIQIIVNNFQDIFGWVKR